MGKKVLIINSNRVNAPYPVPPLGAAILYRLLEGKYQLSLFDGYEASIPSILSRIKEFQPDYIALSIRNIDNMVMAEGLSFVPALKKYFFQPIRDNFTGSIILGGSGFSIFPKELMKISAADYGIIGEAEELLPELLSKLDQGNDPCQLAGIICKNQSLGFSPRTSFFNFAQQPHSDIDLLLDYSPYIKRGAYPIQTKRGCSHHCIYCSYPHLEGKRYRMRKPSDVVDEIEQTKNRFDKTDITFEFVDSTFNDPVGNAENICREIIKRGLQLKLRTMGINPANVTGNLLELMKKAGFSQIDSTPDSASPQMLINLKKNFSLDQLKKTAALIKEFHMPTMWFFLFGGPGETAETIADTVDFIDQFIHQDDLVHMTEGLRIYPHTKLFKEALKEKIIRPEDSLLQPRYYVSPLLGEEQLEKQIKHIATSRTNCIRATESTPSPELMAAAMKERLEQKLQEPMFRTLLRVERRMNTMRAKI